MIRKMTAPGDLLERMTAFQACVESRDVGAALALLDDDFALVLVQPAAATMPRGRWLEVLPSYVIHAYDTLEQAIDVADDLAAVLQRVEMSATVLGEDRSGTFVISDVWRRRDGTWRLWRRHSTPLTAGALPDGPTSRASS